MNRTLILAAAATLAISVTNPAFAGPAFGGRLGEDSISTYPAVPAGLSTRPPAEGARARASADPSRTVHDGSIRGSGASRALESADAVGLAIGLQRSEEAGSRR